MIQVGTILNIEVETLGAELSQDVTSGAADLYDDDYLGDFGSSDVGDIYEGDYEGDFSGASIIHVRTTIDFSDEGGELQIGDEIHTYSPGAVDDEALTITLDAGLESSYSADEFVYVAPAPIVRYWAQIQIDGDDDEAILAEISRALVSQVNTGVRDPDEQETSAVVEERDGTWTVIDILGVEPIIVASALYIPDVEEAVISADSGGAMTVYNLTSSYITVGQGASSAPLIIYDEASFSFAAIEIWSADQTTRHMVIGGGGAFMQFHDGLFDPNTAPALNDYGNLVPFKTNDYVQPFWVDEAGDVLFMTRGKRRTPAALTGTVDDYNPGIGRADTFRLDPNASPRVITGIVAGRDWERITLINIGSTGANTITLNHDDSGSTAANRILCPNNSNYVLQVRGFVDLIYDGVSSRWRVGQ